MPSTNALGELLTTLFDRRPFKRTVVDSRSITELCHTLLSDPAEGSGNEVATAILQKYRLLDQQEKIAFFEFLNENLDVDPKKIGELAATYAQDPSVDHFRALSEACEPNRQELLRRLNQAPRATAELVSMRVDLVSLLKTLPQLERTDMDFVHLLRSWFNRGFLVLRQITWESSASILEKIIAYEAVHEIQTWEALRRRLQPPDRRCFAFFHPAMPGEPLIFVEVALTRGIPNSIQDVLSDDREEFEETEADTAVFYSISNCQKGLARISFGNSLIKQVARNLSADLPGLKSFVTLSPIPGLTRWLEHEGIADMPLDQNTLKKMAARYLLEAKTEDGQPTDPVARFHLGNGAIIHAVHPLADLSENGMQQSGGAMVNYLYDLSRISTNAQSFADNNQVAAATAVKTLAQQATQLKLGNH